MIERFAKAFFRLPDFVLWYLLLTGVIYFTGSNIDYFKKKYLELLPADQVFLYEWVRYVGHETDGTLRFESKSANYRSHDKKWPDVMKCHNNKTGRWDHYVVQKSELPGVKPRGMTVSGWVWTAPWPKGRLCRLHITAIAILDYGVEKRQQLVSNEFITPTH